MPGVNYDMSRGRQLGGQIAYSLNQIRAMATQQQLVISNRKGQPVMVTGLQPGSNPARWGLGIIDRAFGEPVAFFGETETTTTASGTVALTFFATTGKPLIRINRTGLTGYAANGTSPLMALTDSAMTFYSATGKPLIVLDDAGLTGYAANGTTALVKLDDGGLYLTNATGAVLAELTDVGLQVRNPAGAMQMVAGRAVATAAGPLTYSSTTWGALSGGPSVSVVAPPSGEVDISLGAIMKPGSHVGGESCWLRVSLDGSGDYNPLLAASATATSVQDFTCFGESTLTGLTPGTTYTFGVVAQVTTSGVAATYTNVTLKVVPV